MLENATRICEAKFGYFIVAMATRSAPSRRMVLPRCALDRSVSANHRFSHPAGTALAQLMASKQRMQIADIRLQCTGYSGSVLGQTRRRTDASRRADAQG